MGLWIDMGVRLASAGYGETHKGLCSGLGGIQ